MQENHVPLETTFLGTLTLNEVCTGNVDAKTKMHSKTLRIKSKTLRSSATQKGNRDLEAEGKLWSKS